MDFIQFRTTMPWVVILLTVLTVGFAIGEILMPGFGICGILSGICAVAGLICEGVMTQNVYFILILFIFQVVLFLLLLGLFLILSKAGIVKSGIILKKTSLGKDYDKSDVTIKLGKIGKVVSMCKPVGKAMFDEETLTIISTSGNLNVGKKVAVSEIKNNQIYVIEVFGGENE